jgi:adenosylhomocysteine nucleosidase
MRPIIILTALQVEREAVLHHLTLSTTIYHPTTGTDYNKGYYLIPGKGQIEVIVGRTDQTNVNAALETERALAYFDPEYIFFVGVAGGLKDVKVGDIVIGSTVIGYERGKAEDGNFKPRPQFGASTYALERLSSSFATSSQWKEKAAAICDKDFAPEINVLTGAIASGEKVDAGHKSELHKYIKQQASNALAIEMEGLGFLEVCRTRPSVKSLLLRGISDLVEDKEGMDSKGSQPYASKNVSAFLFGLLNELTLNPQPVNVRSQLVEIMCKLYPAGLRDNGIWLSAGGNLALINLNQSGKAQWVEAARMLFQGGGGNITPRSLIQAVLVDFQNNVDVEKLLQQL